MTDKFEVESNVANVSIDIEEDPLDKVINQYKIVQGYSDNLYKIVSMLNILRKKEAKVATLDERRTNTERIKALSIRSFRVAKKTKLALKGLESDVSNGTTVEVQIKIKLYNFNMRKYKDALELCQTAIQDIQKQMKARNKIELTMCEPGLSREHFNEIIRQCPQRSGIDFIQHTITSNNTEGAIHFIEEIHLVISKLEGNLLRFNELFKDLEFITDMQSETADVIEEQIGCAPVLVPLNVKLDQVKIEYTAKEKKNVMYKRLCITILLIVIICCVVIPIWLGLEF
jgi:t-SNARE complex subunit (syntaxin)